jgi:hypothetical protein
MVKLNCLLNNRFSRVNKTTLLEVALTKEYAIHLNVINAFSNDVFRPL